MMIREAVNDDGRRIDLQIPRNSQVGGSLEEAKIRQYRRVQSGSHFPAQLEHRQQGDGGWASGQPTNELPRVGWLCITSRWCFQVGGFGPESAFVMAVTRGL